jgi:hypothetical protein
MKPRAYGETPESTDEHSSVADSSARTVTRGDPKDLGLAWSRTEMPVDSKLFHDWQEALKDGSLSRIDVAFSRDRPEKIYVQQKIWNRRRDLVEWLDNGAYFYVCGDAKAMAKDVRAMLVNAYADVKTLTLEAAEQAVTGLEREKRYLTDTY